MARIALESNGWHIVELFSGERISPVNLATVRTGIHLRLRTKSDCQAHELFLDKHVATFARIIGG